MGLLVKITLVYWPKINMGTLIWVLLNSRTNTTHLLRVWKYWQREVLSLILREALHSQMILSSIDNKLMKACLMTLDHMSFELKHLTMNFQFKPCIEFWRRLKGLKKIHMRNFGVFYLRYYEMKMKKQTSSGWLLAVRLRYFIGMLTKF